MLRFWITAELYEKFRLRADDLNVTMSELLTLYVIQQTKSIDLPPEVYERIAQELKQKGN